MFQGQQDSLFRVPNQEELCVKFSSKMGPLSCLCRWAKPLIGISAWVFQHVGIMYAKIQVLVTYLLHHNMIFSDQAPVIPLAISVRKDSSGPLRR